MSNHYFLDILKDTLEQRQKKNPRYSLRSYAKSIGISVASLSGILNGHRTPTAKLVEKIGVGLELPAEEILLCKSLSAGTKNHYKNLNDDQFNLLADWYNLTLLEVIKLKDFCPDISWIAKRMNLSTHQVQMAVDRLQRIGILEIKGKKWIDRSYGFTESVATIRTSEAKKIYQQQMLQKSNEALIQEDISNRDHTGMTMAIDIEDLPRAKKEIADFRMKLSKILEKTTKPNQVYQLQVSFFALTNSKDQDS